MEIWKFGKLLRSGWKSGSELLLSGVSPPVSSIYFYVVHTLLRENWSIKILWAQKKALSVEAFNS